MASLFLRAEETPEGLLTWTERQQERMRVPGKPAPPSPSSRGTGPAGRPPSTVALTEARAVEDLVPLGSCALRSVLGARRVDVSSAQSSRWQVPFGWLEGQGWDRGTAPAPGAEGDTGTSFAPRVTKGEGWQQRGHRPRTEEWQRSLPGATRGWAPASWAREEQSARRGVRGAAAVTPGVTTLPSREG